MKKQITIAALLLCLPVCAFAQDAEAGKKKAEVCAACHGIDGKLPGNQLVGGRGSIKSPRPLKTVGSYWPYATTLFDYISMSMPYNEEKTMTTSEIYAVTAYVLYMNDIVAPDTSLNRSNLPDVQMPNRDGFIELLE